MSRVFIISDENVASLRDLQVAFQMSGSTVEIVQIESHSEFTGFYELMDLSKFSNSAKRRLEDICEKWLFAQCFPREFNNDDFDIA